MKILSVYVLAFKMVTAARKHREANSAMLGTRSERRIC